MNGIEIKPVGGGDPLSSDPSLQRELAQRYLIWDAFVGGQRRVDVHPLILSYELHHAAVRAAEGVVRTIGKVALRAFDDYEERERYGLRDDVLRLATASHEAGDMASMVRVDLLLDENHEWRACEINADCPGGHNEALALPKLARAAGFMEGANPTDVVERLTAKLAHLANGDAVGLIYATAYSEDLQVCALLQRALEARGTRALLAAPTAPRMQDGHVFIGKTKVGVLYRYFPTEWMDGQRNIDGLVKAIARRRLRTVTSFGHIFSQSKLAFARAWANVGSLEGEDRDVVATRIPYSVDVAELTREELILRRKDWVVKRAMGRVGDQVFVGALYSEDDWIPLLDGIRRMREEGQVWLAQRFVKQSAVPTPWGNRYVTLGAYVQDGQFAGYYARVTRTSHVSHDALCVPVFYDPIASRSAARAA